MLFVPDPGAAPEELLGQLLKTGRLRTLRAGGSLVAGLDVSRSGLAIGVDGTVSTTLVVLGSAVEGSSYYNHYVPSPGLPSRAVQDAERALRSVLPIAAPSQVVAPPVTAG